jgi:hypothetical protein
MTADDLKKLDRSEQKHLYQLFYASYRMATNEKTSEKYRLYLEQLKSIFELDTGTWIQWSADAAAIIDIIMRLFDDRALTVA